MKRIFLLLMLSLAPVAKGADNIVILLDNSLSMTERMRTVKVQKFVAAQEALIGVLDQLPPDANVGILTFKDWIYPAGQLLGMAPVDKAKIAKAIRESAPDPQVGTPLGTYIKQAADALLLKRREEKGFGTYKLLVVTDGEATPEGEGELLNQMVPDILSRGLIMDTIGVDMVADHTLSRNSHSYMKADNPESLKQAVSASLGEVSTKSDGNVGEDDFTVIAAIPDELASQVIAALVEKPSMNWQIGTAKPVEPVLDAQGIPVPEEALASEAPAESELGMVFSVLGGILIVVLVCIGILAVLKGFSSGGY